MKKDTYYWEDYYPLLVNYYNKYGNAFVKIDFKTKDGINYDNNGLLLGEWVYSKIKVPIKNNYKMEMLERLGIEFETNYMEYKWNSLYNLLYKYYKHNGNVNIGISFKTLDGINYNEYGHNLSNWLKNQYRITLTKEKKYKLSKLGINIDETKWEKEWNKYYSLATKFYNYYNHLRILSKFRTIDGINPSSDGFKLGSWIKTQRENKNLSIDRINKLNKIGMIWNVRKNRNDIINLLKMYNININLNDKILSKSYEEVYCKILYLIDNNLPIIDDNGCINNIFYISNTSLFNEYQISIDEIYNKYLKKGIKRGK